MVCSWEEKRKAKKTLSNIFFSLQTEKKATWRCIYAYSAPQIRCSSATIYREFERLFCYIQFFSFSLQELTRDGRSWCWSNLTRPQSAARSRYLQVLFLKLIVFVFFFFFSFLPSYPHGIRNSPKFGIGLHWDKDFRAQKKTNPTTQPHLYRDVSLKLLYSYLAADQPEPRLWPPRHSMGDLPAHPASTSTTIKPRTGAPYWSRLPLFFFWQLSAWRQEGENLWQLDEWTEPYQN